MSQWTTRIETHAVHATLDTLQNILNEITLGPTEPLEALADIERLKTVVCYFKDKLSSIDSQLLTPAGLNNVLGYIQNISNEVSAFAANRNRGHLVNANNHADSALQNTVNSLGLTIGLTVDSDSKSLTSFRETVYKYLNDLNSEKNRLSESFSSISNILSETKADISNQKSRLDTAISEYQQQFSRNENVRMEQFNEAQNVRNKKNEEAIEELRTKLQNMSDQFNDNQNSRSENFDTLTNELKTTFQSLLDTSTMELNTLISNAESNLNQIASSLKDDTLNNITRIEEFRDKAQNLYHVMGSIGMAGEYQKVADSARRMTKFWQVVAGIGMLGLICYAIITQRYIVGSSSGINWAAVAARVFVAAAFGILAAYGVRQADRYSATEMRNRRFQLELSSIDPYLANFPEEQQQSVKVELARKLFGNAGTLPSEDTKVTGSSLDLVQMVLKILQDLVKKSR